MFHDATVFNHLILVAGSITSRPILQEQTSFCSLCHHVQSYNATQHESHTDEDENKDPFASGDEGWVDIYGSRSKSDPILHFKLLLIIEAGDKANSTHYSQHLPKQPSRKNSYSVIYP